MMILIVSNVDLNFLKKFSFRPLFLNSFFESFLIAIK